MKNTPEDVPDVTTVRETVTECASATYVHTKEEDVIPYFVGELIKIREQIKDCNAMIVEGVNVILTYMPEHRLESEEEYMQKIIQRKSDLIQLEKILLEQLESDKRRGYGPSA